MCSSDLLSYHGTVYQNINYRDQPYIIVFVLLIIINVNCCFSIAILIFPAFGSILYFALSEWLEVQVKRNGHIYQQRYERGKICYDLKIVGDCDIEDTGTQVTFLPDSEIFQETTVFEFDILMHRLREMAFLTKGIKITLTDLREEIGRAHV